VPIAILDYGMGNLRSVARAIEHAGGSANVTTDPAQALAADGLVVPGVGHFGACMRNLRECGLDATTDQLVADQGAGGVRADAAVDARDASTHDHSSTVARYAAAIAAQLGLPGDSVERVRIAGLLHDVGKVGIPDSILLKPGKLTDEEWTEMRRHPEIGARIIASPGLADVREWVLRHHERPDGRGYPDGLQRSQIPIEARILSVADAYEAMTADRPYRRALSESTARSEILSGRGSQFDDDVVDAFLSHLDGDAHADRSDAGSAAPGPIVSSAA